MDEKTKPPSGIMIGQDKRTRKGHIDLQPRGVSDCPPVDLVQKG
jgi:hypothetical protein